MNNVGMPVECVGGGKEGEQEGEGLLVNHDVQGSLPALSRGN